MSKKDKINYPNIASEFVGLTHYCRWIPELGRRENWSEVVDRVVGYFKDKDWLNTVPLKVFNKIDEGMRNFSIMPAMRVVATAGKALDSNFIAGFNCSFLPIDSLDSFAELMYILMHGTGVGFSVESVNINKLPEVGVPNSIKRDDYYIEDSREGWKNAIDFGIKTWFAGEDVVFNFSLLRPRGAPLKTMGGTSSGPEPLKRLLEKIRCLIQHAQGRKLTSLECHDICCMIAENVISGGKRRSAMISFSDLDDEAMREAKSGNFPSYRHMANNSAVYKDKPNSAVFMKEWGELALSGTGERGIFVPRYRGDHELRSNPCQPAWAKLLTKQGIRELKDVNVGDEIWSEEGWTKVIKKWSTGIKEVNKYETTAGIFYGTENHRILSNDKKIEVKDADDIDILTGPYDSNYIINPEDVMDGLVLGDGSVHKASNDLVYLCVGENDNEYHQSEIKHLIGRYREGLSEYAYEVNTTIEPSELPKTYSRRVPERYIKDMRNKGIGFLRGLYSANGSVCGNRITLKSASKGLIEDVQLMLNSVGIKSYYTTNKPSSVKFNNGEYLCKESYDLNITTDRHVFVGLIGFIQQYKNDKIKIVKINKVKENYDIINIETISKEEVFDITVDNKSHTYWTQGCNVSNCCEILLRPYEFCNLSEVVVRPDDDIGDLVEKVKTATWLGCIQATFTNFRNIRKVWRKNCEEERLIGVSLTGQFDNMDILTNQVLKQLKNVAIKTAKHASKILKINVPAAITCVKPSGTVSQLVDSAAGCHPRYSKYYIRRYRISTSDPMFKMLSSQGMRWKAENGQTKENCTTAVFEYPIKAPEKAVFRKDINAIDQLNWYLKLQKNWCDHNTSITIYVRDDEWLKVGAMVYENWNEITGVSFFPYKDHKYNLAPYEEIDEERYEKMIKNFPDIDYSKLPEYEKITGDTTKASREFACSGDKCELK